MRRTTRCNRRLLVSPISLCIAWSWLGLYIPFSSILYVSLGQLHAAASAVAFLYLSMISGFEMAKYSNEQTNSEWKLSLDHIELIDTKSSSSLVDLYVSRDVAFRRHCTHVPAATESRRSQFDSL